MSHKKYFSGCWHAAGLGPAVRNPPNPPTMTKNPIHNIRSGHLVIGSNTLFHLCYKEHTLACTQNSDQGM